MATRPLALPPWRVARPWPRRRGRAALVLAHDSLMAGLALVLALVLRVGLDGLGEWLPLLLYGAPLLVLIVAATLLATGMPLRLWRHASIADLILLIKVATLASAAFLPALFLIDRLAALPRSVPVLQWVAFIGLAGGARLAARAAMERRRPGTAPAPAAALLVGTGTGTGLFLRALAVRPEAPYRVIGILDPTGRDVGLRLQRLPVLGGIDELAAVVERLDHDGVRPTRLVVTDRLDPPRLRRLVAEAERLGLVACRLPDLVEFRTAGDDGEIRLEPIPLQELLGRPPVRLDRGPVDRLIAGRRVLVTGAGGSIGSQLVRRIAEHRPAQLTLLELAELNLYSIDQALAAWAPAVPRSLALCDVRDRARVLQLFRRSRPDLVFHAAALKHVPLVEGNITEGARTNVLGTRNVADAACAVGAEAMVLVSTDKAVNPVGVMGATKRFAEFYCQGLDLAGAAGDGCGPRRPRFMTVRFGNVLGTSGSVLPLFRGQLAQGGPLTVTHPDVTRFFMSIEEAVALMLQATAHGLAHGAGRGEIFVLDMGEPVRVVDIARQLIRLAGRVPDAEVPIRFVGLRPGEKLFEELFDSAETRLPPLVDGVLRASSRGVPLQTLEQALEELTEACAQGDEERTRAILARIVPGHGQGSGLSDAA